MNLVSPYRGDRSVPDVRFRAALGFAGLTLAGRRRCPYDAPMSEGIAFDTHRFVKRLTDCGFTEQQAEVLVDEQVALLNGNLATKTDIAEIKADIDAVRQETKAGIDAVRQETKAGIDAVRQENATAMAENATAMARLETRMESIKSDLLKWMIGLMTGLLIGLGGLMVAFVRFL